MKRIVTLLVLATLTGCRGGDGAAPDPEVPPPVEWSADMQTVAEGNNRFALELYAKLRESEHGNLFFSPYSIHTALGMTATGAKGTTRDQMVQVESAEQRYPRPQGSIPPGHYAVVANFVFAIGLHFADMQQSLATQLVKERQSSPSA